MRHKTEKGFFFLVISLSLLVLSFESKTTGAVIGTLNEPSYSFFIGIALFVIAAFIFVSRKTLDVIVIPTGGQIDEDEERTERAKQEGAKFDKFSNKDDEEKGYYMISGEKGDVKHLRDSQRYGIYKHLRKKGVVPSHMIVEGKSHDTEENLLYSLKKLSEKFKVGGRDDPVEVGFVSYSGQLDRFEDFYKEAIKKGLIDENDFIFHKIKTNETNEEKSYEQNPAREILHKYKLTRMGRYKAKDGGIKYAKPDPVVRGLRKTFGFLKKLIPGR